MSSSVVGSPYGFSTGFTSGVYLSASVAAFSYCATYVPAAVNVSVGKAGLQASAPDFCAKPSFAVTAGTVTSLTGVPSRTSKTVLAPSPNLPFSPASKVTRT